MSSVTVIIMLAYAAQAHTEDFVDNLADNLVGKFINRAFTYSGRSLGLHKDLDETTLGKPSNLDPIEDQAVIRALDENFPGSMSGPALQERLVKILKFYGFKPQNTIFGTSLCSDEINTVKGTLADNMKEYWGGMFPLGGIGGAPYVGKTGFGAFSHHVPDNGNVLVLFGPHVGVTASGAIGKCLRVGQDEESTACGACIAAYNQNLAGGIGADMELDMQQSWLRDQVAPHVDRIKESFNPMSELAKVTYEAIVKQVKAITNTKFGPGYLALVGGIQINMPKGYPDYFMPLYFTVQKGDDKPENLLDSLGVPG